MRLLLASALAGALLGGCDTAPASDANLVNAWVLISGSAAEGAEVGFGPGALFGASPVCNSFGGSYSATPDRQIAIDVDGGSRVLCSGDGNEAEVAFLNAVESAETYEVSGDRLTLRGAGVRLVFRLRPE